MKVRDVAEVLNEIAPARFAQEWDNVGLLLGDGESEVRKLLLCIDLTREVLAEAGRTKAQMVMAYHPVIFKSISRLTADVAPVAYAAANRGLAVYSMHTALDAVPGGANDVLADLLGLEDRRPLQPAVHGGRCKLVVFTPAEDLSAVADAAFEAGAGRIGMYERCAFFCHGIGTFLGGEQTRPAVGQSGRQEATEELRLELSVAVERVTAVCRAIRQVHSYEEPVIEVYSLEDHSPSHGLGRIGSLANPVTARTLVTRIKKALDLNRVSVAWARGGAGASGEKVGLAACCAGSCGTLYRTAAQAGASFYLTGEMRHHHALEAAALGMTAVCVGHSNSERPTLNRLAETLSQRLGDLPVAVSKEDRDPLNVA